MKSPVLLVTVGLTAAILLAASLLVATGTRGDDALWPSANRPATKAPSVAPASKSANPKILNRI